MNPKEKAKQLFEDFLSIQNGGEKFGWNNDDAEHHREMAKLSALRCVSEIREEEYLENAEFWNNVNTELLKIPTTP